MQRRILFKRIQKILINVVISFIAVVCVLSAEAFSKEAYGVQDKAKTAVCAVYFTGIGCSNCAEVNPVLFTDILASNPNLIIFEYEVYRAKKQNNGIKKEYFASFMPGSPMGVPFLLYNRESRALGKAGVISLANKTGQIEHNAFPTREGKFVDLGELDIAGLPGKVHIWTRNRVFISGKNGDSEVLRKLILADNIENALRSIEHEKVAPIPIAISEDDLEFENAVKIDDWLLQWNEDIAKTHDPKLISMKNSLYLMLFVLVLLGVSFSFFRIQKTGKGAPLKFELRARIRDIVIVGVSLVALIVFFILAKYISSDFLEQTGYKMPLPIFTFIIALVDGFNPCNMFVLTCLLALLISTSDSKKRLYVVAFSFIAMVYIFYFMFMAAWLEAMKYIGFVAPLRITIAILALAVGFINCKELFFFKKGISLTISDKQKGPLMKRMQGMKEIIKNGSFPLLITSSIGLATLASLVELPCTAGFPIIYTGILTGKGLENSFAYYGYLMYYNLIYVLPLMVIIVIFIYSFRARQITQRQMEIIKFIGGIIMILLGIVLLVNPGLLGLGIG